jgi:hypothetical protein
MRTHTETNANIPINMMAMTTSNSGDWVMTGCISRDSIPAIGLNWLLHR